tara:strand:+ start:14437 stop:15402 length:966 start_codon:yes stop_codon:yes gene_type:complete
MYLNTRARASSFIYQQAREFKGVWLIPDNICHAVYVDICMAGSTIELMDVDLESLELDTNKVSDYLKHNQVAGIVLVRAFGSLKVNYESFFAFIKDHYPEVYIIDDRCLCFPQFTAPKDTLADMILYSTGYSKVVDLGYGGYCFSKSKLETISMDFLESDEEKFDSFFKESIDTGVPISEQSFKIICDSLWLNHAQVNTSKYFDELKEKLDLVKLHKTRLNEIYGTINQEMIISPEFNDWRFNIVVGNRSEVLKKIFEQGLFASHHYYPLGLFFSTQYKSVWNTLREGILNLFNDLRVTEEGAIRTVNIINEYGRPFKYDK